MSSAGQAGVAEGMLTDFFMDAKENLNAKRGGSAIRSRESIGYAAMIFQVDCDEGEEDELFVVKDSKAFKNAVFTFASMVGYTETE